MSLLPYDKEISNVSKKLQCGSSESLCKARAIERRMKLVSILPRAAEARSVILITMQSYDILWRGAIVVAKCVRFCRQVRMDNNSNRYGLSYLYLIHDTFTGGGEVCIIISDTKTGDRTMYRRFLYPLGL